MRFFPYIRFLESHDRSTSAQYVFSNQTIELANNLSLSFIKHFYDTVHELGHHYIYIFTHLFKLPNLNRWQWYWEELDMYLQPLIIHLRFGYGRSSTGWHLRYELYAEQSPELVHLYRPPL